MEKIKVHNLEVRFPFKPYPIQKTYMNKKSNALLESPTGTGKTLSLLCSTMAWLEESKKKALTENENEVSLESEQVEVHAVTDLGRRTKGKITVPKAWIKRTNRIIYSSRTHIQLSQAITELKRTDYNTMDAVVLGSRDQLCLHPTISQLSTGVQSKNEACRVMVNHNKCQYYSGYYFEKKVFIEEDYINNPVLDIEDLRALGRKHVCCPYYAAKELHKKADIIFMPYNYIIDPMMRASVSVGLKNNVVIFDEGHNIEKCFEDSMSCELTSGILASAIGECTRLMQIMESNEDDGFDIILSDILKVISPVQLAKLKTILLEFEEQIDKLLEKNEEIYLDSPRTIFSILELCNLDESNYKAVLKTLDDLVTSVSEHSITNPSLQNAIFAFKSLDTFITTVFPLNPDHMQLRMDIFLNNYKVYVQKYNPNETRYGHKKVDTSKWHKRKSTTESDFAWTLHCVCLSPSVGMKSLVEEEVHSVIITSGTLAPLNSFQAELGIPFNVRLQSPHIVPAENLKVFILPNGGDNSVLDGTFKNRTNQKYYKSLGKAVVDFCQRVPGGVFVFFSSYSVLSNCCKYWEDSFASEIWKPLTMAKAVYKEPTGKDSFQCALAQFKMKVDETRKGAVFMGVCRGKLSEGLDLGDQYCRGVIIVGLPFPNFKEKNVILKRQYLDKQRNSDLTSNDWYTLQMKRALNQAVGRVLRHKNDYGVVLLADERFRREKRSFSNWIQDYIVEHSYKDTMFKISDFFVNKSVNGRSNGSSPQGSPEKLPTLAKPQVSSKPSTSTGAESHRFSDELFDEYSGETVCISESPKTCQTQSSSQQSTDSSGSSVFFDFLRSVENNVPKKREVPSNGLNGCLKDRLTITKRKKINEEPGSSEASTSSIKNEETFIAPSPLTVSNDVLIKQSHELRSLPGGKEKFSLIVALFRRYKSHKNTCQLAEQLKNVFKDLEKERRNKFIIDLSPAVPINERRTYFQVCEIMTNEVPASLLKPSKVEQ